MDVQGVIKTLPGRVGYLHLMALFLYALPILSSRSADNPDHLQGVPLNAPATGNAAIPTPMLVHPVTENRPVHMIVSVRKSTAGALVLPEQVAADQHQVEQDDQWPAYEIGRAH